MRRDLHQIPELGFDLPKTKAYVTAELKRLGISYKESELDSSLVATIKGNGEGKTIAFRGDMDALPIVEENVVDYISRHEGRMHGCGHDTHTAMLLAAAKVLNENRDKFCGTIKLLFQTAEETARGAEIMIKNGAIDDVDAIFGLHIGSIMGKDIKSGKAIIASGCIMASYDKFIITVNGVGCHGSTPEKGVDPINVASHIVTSLQTVIAREVSATKPVVMTFGKISGGEAYNAIPGTVILEGTIRALEENAREYLAKRIEEISKGVAKTFRADCDVEIVWGAPPVINHEETTKICAEAAALAIGSENVLTSIPAPNMGGEDFACYLQKIPGTFIFLSSSNAEKGTDRPHHNPKFNVDEDVLYEGTAIFVSIAEKLLGLNK
ncbi:MAG: M20 family metallopeptidase [Oscillospiraceae bacterium]